MNLWALGYLWIASAMSSIFMFMICIVYVDPNWIYNIAIDAGLLAALPIGFYMNIDMDPVRSKWAGFIVLIFILSRLIAFVSIYQTHKQYIAFKLSGVERHFRGGKWLWIYRSTWLLNLIVFIWSGLLVNQWFREFFESLNSF